MWGSASQATNQARVLGLRFLREEVPYKHSDPLTLPSFEESLPVLALTLFLLPCRFTSPYPLPPPT